MPNFPHKFQFLPILCEKLDGNSGFGRFGSRFGRFGFRSLQRPSLKPGFHTSQFIGDPLSRIAEGENDFRNTKNFIHCCPPTIRPQGMNSPMNYDI